MVAGSGQQPCGRGPNHLGSTWPKNKEKKGSVGPISAQPFWADISPLFSGFMPGPVVWAGPAHML